MKDRKHHNNNGNRHIKNGGTRRFAKYLKHKYGIRGMVGHANPNITENSGKDDESKSVIRTLNV